MLPAILWMVVCSLFTQCAGDAVAHSMRGAKCTLGAISDTVAVST
jgi:hypothetical protein